jgi:hypothetical protein
MEDARVKEIGLKWLTFYLPGLEALSAPQGEIRKETAIKTQDGTTYRLITDL